MQKGEGGQLLPPEPHVGGSALAAGDHMYHTRLELLDHVDG